VLTKLADLGRSRRYWLALAVFCAAMLGVALYYQYVLENLPCLVCIQVRILVLGIGLVASCLRHQPGTTLTLFEG
jgi:disulfide bond formation protein DsbB